LLQALIGVAFSVGFIVGPLIGAYFSQQAQLVADVSDMFFTSPALFALTLAMLNVFFLSICLQETLSADKRVKLVCVIVSKSLGHITCTDCKDEASCYRCFSSYLQEILK